MRKAETAPNSSRLTPARTTKVRAGAPGALRSRQSAPVSRRASRRPLADRLAPYVLVAPAVLIIVGFPLYPLALGINFSFTGDGDRNGQAVGLDNYAILFSDPLFRTALQNVGLLVLLLPIAVAIPDCWPRSSI
jgi:multiple sugar transport system permease protein